MNSSSTKLHGRAIAGGALAAALILFAAPSQAQTAQAAGGPFAAMAGTWSGTGTIAMGDGAKERLRCRVTYRVNERGSAFDQELRCASDNYKFELKSHVEASGTDLSGFWTEVTRNTGGKLTGTLRGERVQAFVETPGFSATLALVTRGERQAVKIQSPSTDIKEIEITLNKGG